MNEQDRSCRRQSTTRRKGGRRRIALVGVCLLFSHQGDVVTAFCPSCRGDKSQSVTVLRTGSQGELRPYSGPFRQLIATLPQWPSMNRKTPPKPKDWLTEKISDTVPPISSSSSTVLGLVLFVFIIFVLSGSNDPVPLDARVLAGSGGQGFEILESSLETAGRNVLKASLPQTASDVVSVALGEGIAGVIGAMATLVVSLLLRLRAANAQLIQGVIQKQDLVREAVADGDYFVTRAAAIPLFEAVGLSPLAASVSSVILASVPYEVIKLGSSREAARRAEDLLMEELLKQEQEKKRKEKGIFSFMSNGKTESSVDPLSLVPVADAKPLDVVELFSDITKWLEYDVLKADLSGRLVWNGQVLASNIDSALFGFVAALSSQLYADIAYTYTNYGPEEKRKESRERTLAEWIKLYATTSINSAVLFGVYETVKIPVANVIASFLSGGIENCVGSNDYKTCVDSYIRSNPPEADAAAQFRSLITSLLSLWDRLLNDGSLDKEEFTRSLIVQLYSFWQQIFSFTLFAADVGVEPSEFISM